MLWLVVAILAYFFFALSSLGDKLVLSGAPKPATYTFYVGLSSLAVLVLVPFANLGIPSADIIFWIVASGIVHMIGVYTMFVATEKFEISKVATTIGATQPIFIFGLMWVFFGEVQITTLNIVAFILLFLGSVIISMQKGGIKLNGYMKIVLISSFMFSLDYIFQKKIFLGQTFLQGLVWTRLALFIFVLFFLFSKKARNGIFFRRKEKITAKDSFVFASAQTAGGLANILQSWAIFLAPVAFLPIVNSLRGVQYVFLFIMTILTTIFLPRILKEKISTKIIFLKVVSILMIGLGLAILVIE